LTIITTTKNTPKIKGKKLEGEWGWGERMEGVALNFF